MKINGKKKNSKRNEKKKEEGRGRKLNWKKNHGRQVLEGETKNRF